MARDPLAVQQGTPSGFCWSQNVNVVLKWLHGDNFTEKQGEREFY